MSTFTPDDDMLQQYIQKKLSPQDEEQLELWLAENPHVLEELELDLMMQDGLLSQDTTKKQSKNIHFEWQNLMSIFRKPAFLSTLLAVFTFIASQYYFLQSSTVIESNTSIIYIEQMRGNTPSAIIDRNEKVVIIVLSISGIENKEYLIQFMSNDEVIHEITDLTPKNMYPYGNGLLTFPLKISHIPKGEKRFALFDQTTHQKIMTIDVLIE
ncbi:hypothetical protein [Marinicella sp. W31]|uniref:hypothetical protein n=1 Tax=Marinicella sp. W31 TaxID=3023713 RepID=UPI00375786A1